MQYSCNPAHYTASNGLILEINTGPPLCVCWDAVQVLSVYESTFVGLQGLAAHFPKGTPEFEAAEAALTDVLGHLVSDVKGVYGDDVLYQVC